ncbi:hypothetical protein B1J93_11850 [Leptospira kirschneri serovar Pomona]|uniref:Uncharacterized protein n=1 Tax=Leptospira kirschneri serovar Pomona TaxID=561005 RepID=A0A1T1DLQ3_9LEPT|nr:hypothetical protein B1J93_11850 [Leptospira kirschneri serovar Pomona]
MLDRTQNVLYEKRFVEFPQLTLFDKVKETQAASFFMNCSVSFGTRCKHLAKIRLRVEQSFQFRTGF